MRWDMSLLSGLPPKTATTWHLTGLSQWFGNTWLCLHCTPGWGTASGGLTLARENLRWWKDLRTLGKCIITLSGIMPAQQSWWKNKFQLFYVINHSYRLQIYSSHKPVTSQVCLNAVGFSWDRLQLMRRCPCFSARQTIGQSLTPHTTFSISLKLCTQIEAKQILSDLQTTGLS